MGAKTKGFLAEFKAFAMRGNVFDMAIGVLIATQTTAIINSIVNDLITPLIGFILGSDTDLSGIRLVLRKATTAGEADLTLNIGAFLNTIINFLIVMFCLFLLVKMFNTLHAKKEPEVVPEPVVPEDTLLLREIVAQLKKNK